MRENNLVVKKFLAAFGLIPGVALLLLGSYNALLTLLAQVFSDFLDFRNFSIVNLFTPFTSVGGSGTLIDSVVAGPGASGGSAIRYWTYMIYALMAAVGFTTIKTCWKIIAGRSD